MNVRLGVPPVGDFGIERTLRALIALAARKRDDAKIHELALALTTNVTNRDGQMRAIVDEVGRRFVYAPDPTKTEFIGPVPLTRGEMIDVDDACLFVAAVAMSVGIPCCIVGARYVVGEQKYDRWTCVLAYENEVGFWAAIDPLRQKSAARIRIEELVIFEPEPSR